MQPIYDTAQEMRQKQRRKLNQDIRGKLDALCYLRKASLGKLNLCGAWKYEDREFSWVERCRKDIQERQKGYTNMPKHGLWQE